MSSAKQTLVHTGPAIPERPAPPLKLYFGVPNVAPEKSHTVPLSAVVLEHVQFNIISRETLAKLPDDNCGRGPSPIRIPNLLGGHYIVQDEKRLIMGATGKTEAVRETFCIESNDSEEWDSSIDVLLSHESGFSKGYLRGGLKFPIVEFDPKKPKVPGSAHRDYSFGGAYIYRR